MSDTPKAYRVKDWSTLYENNRTREMKTMQWVPVPIKHDGEGFRLLMAMPDGLKIFACWILILETAAKSHPRGTLLRRDGTQLTPDAIATKTSCVDVAAMRLAFEVLSSSQIGWLEQFTIQPAEIPHPPAEIPQEPARKGMEGNGMEVKYKATARREEEAPQHIAVAGKFAALADDATTADAIEFLRSNHRAYRSAPEHALAAAIGSFTGSLDRAEINRRITELMVDYAGDAEFGPNQTPVKRLKSYLRGRLEDRNNAIPEGTLT